MQRYLVGVLFLLAVLACGGANEAVNGGGGASERAAEETIDTPAPPDVSEVVIQPTIAQTQIADAPTQIANTPTPTVPMFPTPSATARRRAEPDEGAGGGREPQAIELDEAGNPRPPRGLKPAQVVEVIDGDTVDVHLLSGDIVRVRLIGMDTPEIVDPREPVQCFGQEASEQAKALLPVGLTVLLEADPTQGERDQYDRLLRYLWLGNGTLFNLEMIRQGFAHEYTYDLPYKYQALFQQAEESARVNRYGFWSPESCDGDTTQPA